MHHNAGALTQISVTKLCPQQYHPTFGNLGFWLVSEPFRVSFFFRSSCSPNAISQSTNWYFAKWLNHVSVMACWRRYPTAHSQTTPGFQYNPSCGSRIILSSGGQSVLLFEVLLVTKVHRFTPPSSLSDFLFSVFSLYLLRISYMYFQLRCMRFKIGLNV